MKKIVSLLLAAMLCMCTMAPAMADGLAGLLAQLNNNQNAEAFNYTLAEYQEMFDMLAGATLQATPVWTNNGDTAVASIEGYGDVIVTLNAEGKVTKLNTEIACSLDNIETGANAFGMLVAVTALSSKVVEDPNFTSGDNIDNYTNELLGVMYGLMGDIAKALEAPISSTGEVADDTVTFTLAVDMEAMALVFGFVYEP